MTSAASTTGAPLSLACNRCWKTIEGTGYVTSCSHFFCHDCARKSFGGIAPSSVVCAVCDTSLSERANGFVREVDQKTSNKTIQLCGLTPEQILKVSSRAIDFYLYQTDLLREHERGTTHQREHELQRETDELRERLVHFENDVNTLSHQVQRLQDANDKSRAELADSAQKLEEKSRQKRKLYEMYTALKQKAENQGLLFSPSSSHRSIASAPHYDPPPLPVSSAPMLQPPPPPPMLNYRRNSSPTRQPPVASAFVGAAASPPPKPLSSSMAPPRFAPMGASASVDDGAMRRPFSSPSSLRAAAQAATELGQRRVKSPRLSLGNESVRRFDKFSALRTDFAAQRANSPANSEPTVNTIAAMPLAPPRMPLASISSNLPSTAASASTGLFAQSVRKSTDAFTALTQATPVQSFASRLRRPDTPGRPRRNF